MFRELPPDHKLAQQGIPLCAERNQWPAEQPELREAMDVFVDEMTHCGEAIMRAIAVGLELPENYFHEYYTEGFWVSRLIHYPPPTATAAAEEHEANQADQTDQTDRGEEANEQGGQVLRGDAVGCGEHTDYGCLTMVLSDDTCGCLEVRGRTETAVMAVGQEQQWLRADPLPGTHAPTSAKRLFDHHYLIHSACVRFFPTATVPTR